VIVNSSFFPRLPLFLLVLAIIFLDQVSKSFVGSILSFTCNKGIAFGVGGNALMLSILVLILIAVFVYFEKDFLRKLSLLAIFGGGLSNLIDRFVVGCVRDFIAIGLFPAFNIADIAITIGALSLVLSLFKNRHHK